VKCFQQMTSEDTLKGEAVVFQIRGLVRGTGQDGKRSQALDRVD
jgi:hypothetical protein